MADCAVAQKNWDELFVNKGFCNEKQQIGLKGFTFMIRDVCRRYQTSELHISMKDCSGSDGWVSRSHTVLFLLIVPQTNFEPVARNQNNQSVRSVVMGIKGLLVEEDAAYTVSRHIFSSPSSCHLMLSSAYGQGEVWWGTASEWAPCTEGYVAASCSDKG